MSTVAEYWKRRNEWVKQKDKNTLMNAPPISEQLTYNPVDKVRLQLLDLFARKRVALSCSGECFTCSDFQVIACLVDNIEVLGIEIKEV